MLALLFSLPSAFLIFMSRLPQFLSQIPLQQSDWSDVMRKTFCSVVQFEKLHRILCISGSFPFVSLNVRLAGSQGKSYNQRILAEL